MYNKIDMAMYEQMGFSKQQVKKALEFSQKNNMDIFDALQYLQRKQHEPIKNQITAPLPKNPESVSQNQKSVLYPFKNVNLGNFEIIYSKKSSRMNLPGRKVDLRQQFSPVGLLNVYNCCYLNSLLQCYFLSSDLIKYILLAQPLSSLQSIDPKKSAVKVKRIQNQYNLLNSLKEIFARMALTSSKYIDPTSVLRNLVDSVGQKIEYGDEKDLFETNILIIERLNECLLYTKKYFKPQNQERSEDKTQDEFMSTNSNGRSVINQSKIKQRDNIKRLFYGQKVEYTGEVSSKKETQQILSDFVGIIINPAHGNLYKALYQQFHYEVQIDSEEQKKKIKTKKHTYIREVPTYLYFYINRTGYNAQEKQALKNEQKLSFDFVIYLDSFMEKYREETSANSEIITGLWRKKNMLQKKRHAIDLFAKKLQECRLLASAIQGWRQKLPQQQEIDEQTQTIDKQLQDIQKELQKIESRKQKYCLMYVFVHRGDAISGHYWGYGRNADHWYKFDINTNKINQEDILLDLYKCGGTPYALVYAKQQSIPRVSYKYYKDFAVASEQGLLDLDHKNHEKQSVLMANQSVHVALIPQGTKKVIIAENILLHQEYTKKRNFQITTKLVKEYLTRFNCVQNQALQASKKSTTNFKLLPSYDNFSVFLWTKNQLQLSKYSIYSASLKAVANITLNQVMQDQILLKSIQKQFQKKAKKNKSLKHFCIQFQPQQGDKYNRLFTEYMQQKQMFLLLLKVIFHIQLIAKLNSSNQPVTQQTQSKVYKLLRRIAIIFKNVQNNTAYIKFILKELTSVFIIQFVRAKCVLKLTQQELKLLVDDMMMRQLKIIAGKQVFVLQNTPIDQKQYDISRRQNQLAQLSWAIEDIGKGPNPQILHKKFSLFIDLTKTQVQIFKKLTKFSQLSQINPKTGQVQDYNPNGIINNQKEESLI